MRKFLVSAALAASTLAVAAPAAAQFYPAPQPGYAYNNGYGYPQGNAYGYNNYGQVRSTQARIDMIQRQIIQLDRRNILSNREARSLLNESRDLEYRLQRSARYGLNYNEQRDIQYRVARLEQRVQREARDGNRYGNRYGYDQYGYNQQYGAYNNGYRYPDRDRDGRDDRREDDHGYRHDD